MLILLFLIQTVKFGEHGAFKQPGAENEDSSVGILVDNLSVGHYLNRGTVDYNIIVERLAGFNQFTEARGFKKFGWVGRDRADGHNL